MINSNNLAIVLTGMTGIYAVNIVRHLKTEEWVSSSCALLVVYLTGALNGWLISRARIEQIEK